jgi:hypothetical protein
MRQQHRIGGCQEKKYDASFEHGRAKITFIIYLGSFLSLPQITATFVLEIAALLQVGFVSGVVCLQMCRNVCRPVRCLSLKALFEMERDV